MRNKEKHKIAKRKHYLENKQDYAERLINKRKLLYELVNVYKNFCKCAICGCNENCCLDFHHKKPENKLKGITQLCQDGVSPVKLFAEIKKCQVLCANCHRLYHHNNKEKLKDECEIAEVTIRRRIRTKWFDEYRKNFKCNKCELSNVFCLEFHHRNPNEKFMGVSEMVCFAYSEDKIKAEIEKCDILCANCHRMEHQKKINSMPCECDG